MIRDFLWTIFGNSDDWPPPQWYYTNHAPGKWGAPDWLVRAAWLLWRNPLHNLMAYRWGLVGLNRETVTLYGPHVWAPEGRRWSFGVSIVAGKEYPFISYRGRRVEWYVGWRLPNGGLGIALRRAKS